MWNQLRDEILKRMDEIDRKTGWSPLEPEWWKEMDAVRTVLLTRKT
jgi:hypothetical protein